MSAQNQMNRSGSSNSSKGEISDSVRKKTSVSRRSGKSDGAFRTISEVADELDVQQHVLRFWETKFSQVRPLKRGGGRRYYRPEDFALLQTIHHLLYTEGYTIKGVQKLLREQGKNAVVQNNLPEEEVAAAPAIKPVQSEAVKEDAPKAVASASFALDASKRAALQETLSELRDLRGMLVSE